MFEIRVSSFESFLKPLLDPIGIIINGPWMLWFGRIAKAREVRREDFDAAALQCFPEFREGLLRPSPAVEAEQCG